VRLLHAGPDHGGGSPRQGADPFQDVEVLFVPEEGHQASALGFEGLGELGNVGTAAAVANAVFHATGRRIRDLPARIEDLL
jgi:xanthine dehydrogenase YagR molybdenum-binding subunit